MMGAASLICGGKSLSAVEPVQSRNIHSTVIINGDKMKQSFQYHGRQISAVATAGVENSAMNSEKGAKSGRVKGRGSAENSSNTCIRDASIATVPLCTGAEQVLDRYTVKALIGKGKYSQVLSVEDKQTNKCYALKVLRRNSTVEGNCYDTEMRILKHCAHPSIVTLYESFQYRDSIYLVLELALGGDLFDRIATKGCFSEDNGKAVLKMITSGLSYLHNNGITHRDLKLENILFKHQEKSQILITDFGLAHWTAIPTSTSGERRVRIGMSTTCGTAEYMSPEMLEGEVYCEKIDVWALGVVGYVVLSGNMPFVEGNRGRAKLFQSIKKGQYSFSDKVSLIKQCQ